MKKEIKLKSPYYKDLNKILLSIETFLKEKLEISQKLFQLQRQIIITDVKNRDHYKPYYISIHYRPTKDKKWKIEVNCGWPGNFSNYDEEGDVEDIINFLKQPYCIKKLKTQLLNSLEFMSYFDSYTTKEKQKLISKAEKLIKKLKEEVSNEEKGNV